MKLLIELDEEYVKAIDKIRFLVGGRTDRKLQLEIIKAIKNGKVLEQEPIINKIRAEIKDWQTDIHDNEYDADKYDFVFERIFEIIDEYKGESEK